MDLVERLLFEDKISLNAPNDSTFFEFIYLKYEREKFILQTWANNELVGVIQVNNAKIDFPFEKDYIVDEKKNYALCISDRIRNRYSGVGTALISFAMGISKIDRKKEFIAVANKNSSSFYEHLGFELESIDNDEDETPVLWNYNYNLSQNLPKIEILRK